MSLLKKALADLANRVEGPAAPAPAAPPPPTTPAISPAPPAAALAAGAAMLPPPIAQAPPAVASPPREEPAAELVLGGQLLVAPAPLPALRTETGFVAQDVAIEIDRRIGELHQIVSSALAADCAPQQAEPRRIARPVHISSVADAPAPLPDAAAAPSPGAAQRPGRSAPQVRPPIAFPVAADDAMAAYRQIRDRLQAEQPATGWTVLGLTATEAAGEVFAASLLGQAFAEVGRGRTLLVDARAQGLRDWQLAAVARPVGLTDLVHGRSRWSDVILTTTFPGLDIATAGSLQWADEPLPRGLWDAVRGRYAVVLVDAGSVPQPAALRVAAVCDAAILAVHLMYDDRQSVRQCALELRHAGADLLGTIAVGQDR